MAYTLGSITLPKPKRLVRQQFELSVEHLLVFGKTTKRVTHRKEIFILNYVYLTQAVINTILSQYELGTVLDFTVDETNVEVPTTQVLMDVTGLKYPASGEAWLEDIQIILTEVV
jgi:hypothetical protein